MATSKSSNEFTDSTQGLLVIRFDGTELTERRVPKLVPGQPAHVDPNTMSIKKPELAAGPTASAVIASIPAVLAFCAAVIVASWLFGKPSVEMLMIETTPTPPLKLAKPVKLAAVMLMPVSIDVLPPP